MTDPRYQQRRVQARARVRRSRLGPLAWGLLAAALFLVALALHGCAGRHLETAETALAGYQQLHYEVCEAGEPLIPLESCVRHFGRLRWAEERQRSYYESAQGLAGVIHAARPYAEALWRALWPILESHLPAPISTPGDAS